MTSSAFLPRISLGSPEIIFALTTVGYTAIFHINVSIYNLLQSQHPIFVDFILVSMDLLDGHLFLLLKSHFGWNWLGLTISFHDISHSFPAFDAWNPTYSSFFSLNHHFQNIFQWFPNLTMMFSIFQWFSYGSPNFYHDLPWFPYVFPMFCPGNSPPFKRRPLRPRPPRPRRRPHAACTRGNGPFSIEAWRREPRGESE